MMPLKNNYARDSSSLVYRLEERPVEIENVVVPVPRIEWVKETDVDVDEVISGAPRKRSNAEAFLEKVLAKGPCDASTVYDAAMKGGVSKRTLERAKQC